MSALVELLLSSNSLDLATRSIESTWFLKNAILSVFGKFMPLTIGQYFPVSQLVGATPFFERNFRFVEVRASYRMLIGSFNISTWGPQADTGKRSRWKLLDRSRRSTIQYFLST